jgi:hypothetical protein
MADTPFDPDAYIASKAKAFDPDEYIRMKAAETQVPPPSAEPGFYQTAKDVARVGSNAATFGLWPRVAGALDAATSDKTYSQATDEQVAMAKAAQQRLGPLMSSTADALGGLTSGTALARGGATLLGRVAQLPWWQRLGAGATEAGLYGAAQGAGNTYSENLPDYVRNASIGGGLGTGLGLAVPGVGLGASAIYRKGADIVSGIPSKLASAARADAPGLANVANLGPEAMLLDAGPSMQSVAQAYVQGTGPYRSKIVNALMARDEGTTARLQTARETALGPAPRISEIETALNADRKAVNALYEPHLQGTTIDQQGAASTLKTLRGLEETRDVSLKPLLDRLEKPGLELSSRQWLNVRHRADDLTSEAARAGRNNEASVYGEARKLIDAQLALSAPGVKAVDAQFAHIKKQGEALQLGRNIYDTGKEAIHPADLADIAKAGDPLINMRLRQGAHADLERRLGTTERDLSKLEGVINAPWNREKSVVALGPQPTADIAQAAAANRQFREGYDRIARGSDTAQRQAALRENELAPLPAVPATMWGRIEQPFRYAVEKARTDNQERMRERIAERLIAQGAARDAEVNRLLLHNAVVMPRSDALDKYHRAAAQGGFAGILNPFYATEKQR